MKRISNGLLGGALAIALALGGYQAAVGAIGDQSFVQEAASGGKMEVALGQYAGTNAADPQVRSFGERMVTDHSKANVELTRVAERAAIPVPKEPAIKHEAMLKRLTALKGAEFDRAYMKAMVEDHEADVAKFREAAQSAETPEVRQFAQKTLPTLEEHLKMAKEINARMEKQASAATK